MTATAAAFDYQTAFSRNLGFISEAEQGKLRRSRVAIAGLGGTGGAQVTALARMGIGAFTLADPDVFELVNFNRQSGATIPNIGRRKTEVAFEQARSINPDAEVRLLSEGIGAATIHQFLEDVDVVVDSLDFYCFAERFLLYRTAREHHLWVITAPPLGYGFTLLIFDPDGMTFEDYFGFTPTMSEREQVVALISGIAPRPYLLRYLDRQATSLVGRRLPSVGAAPFMIAGVVATEVVTLLLGQGRRIAVPTIYQFDARLRTFRRHTYRLGMHGPFQRLKRILIAKNLPR
jgi:molybdopterin/thiamine biosynthesis adenylyltransferase